MSIITKSNDCDQVIVSPPVESVPLDVNGKTADEALADPVVRFSKLMRMSMRHYGVEENAVPVDSEAKWGPVTDTGTGYTGTGYGYVAPTGRDPNVTYGKKCDVFYNDDYGTFTSEKINIYPVDPYQIPQKLPEEVVNITFAEADPYATDPYGFDYVEAVPALGADNNLKKTWILEGRRGEVEYDPITEDNFLDRPGLEVNTKDTYLYKKQQEENQQQQEDDLEYS